MISNILNILIFVNVVLIAGTFWYLSCNQKTYKQRIDIIEKIPSSEWRVVSPDFHAVEYEDHLRRLFFFRNPLTLYSARIQKIMEEAND